MYLKALSKPVHISWLVAWTSTGIVVGIMLAARLEQGFFSELFWLIGGIVLLGFGVWRRKRWCILFVLITGLSIGGWRGSVTQHELTAYKNALGGVNVVTGTVPDDPDTNKTGDTTIQLRDVRIGTHYLPGKLWVSIHGKSLIERSDLVSVYGKLGKGFGNYPASMYRVSVKSIKRPTPGDVALHFRDAFGEQVRKGVSEPAASLGLGYLVGQRRALPSALDEALRTASLMHVVVASGYNLTVLVRLSRRLFAKVSKFLAVFVSSGLVISFMAITGLSPSMSRAGLVAFLSLAAWYYGRRFHPVILLAFAAAVTVMIEPSYGWNDLGWGLSFASFAGVMLLAPVLQKYFFGDKKPGILRQVIGETLSAQAATLPLLVMSFGYISIVGTFANLLVVPLVPLAMLLTFIAGVGAWIVPSLAHVFGWPAEQLLNYMVWIAKTCADQPWARLDVQFSWMIAVLFYGLLIGCGVWMWRASQLNLRTQNIIE